jgi:hypothetical protein
MGPRTQWCNPYHLDKLYGTESQGRYLWSVRTLLNSLLGVRAYEPVVIASWTGWLWSSLSPKMSHPKLLATAEARHLHPYLRLMTVHLKGPIQYYLRPPKRAGRADARNEKMKLTYLSCGRVILVKLQNKKLTLQSTETQIHRKFMEW